MSNNYVSPGEVIQFANTTGNAITSGSVVVVGAALGVALVNIPASTGVGSVAIEGVFELPKASGGEINAYTRPVWDVSAKKFIHTAGASTDIVGGCIAIETAASAATTVKVKLTPASAALKGGG